jgi:hypothetical protein
MYAPIPEVCRVLGFETLLSELAVAKDNQFFTTGAKIYQEGSRGR